MSENDSDDGNNDDPPPRPNCDTTIDVLARIYVPFIAENVRSKRQIDARETYGSISKALDPDNEHIFQE